MSGEPVLRLFSGCLLSKHGFNDGDEPDSWLDYCEQRGLSFDYRGWHSVLRQLVKRHLLPALDQKVVTVNIETFHNPIRASAVDGMNVEDCWSGPQPEPELTPEYVEIPMSEVARVAAELAGR
jgi:hypothetical protein